MPEIHGLGDRPAARQRSCKAAVVREGVLPVVGPPGPCGEPLEADERVIPEGGRGHRVRAPRVPGLAASELDLRAEQRLVVADPAHRAEAPVHALVALSIGLSGGEGESGQAGVELAVGSVVGPHREEELLDPGLPARANTWPN